MTVAVGSIAVYRAQIGMGMANSGQGAEAVVDPNGNLRVPADYRTSYQFLGSWAIAADKGQGSKEMHIVYAHCLSSLIEWPWHVLPSRVPTHRRSDRFAICRHCAGRCEPRADTEGWFVMVKESKDTHPDNKLWGDGWAWSWFGAGKPTKTTSTNYRTDCLGCHTPAQATDLVYVGGYPPLRPAQ